VLVFEDLHWADEELLDFVDELVDWVERVPLLVVATARPELFETAAGLGRGQEKRAHRVACAARRRRHGTAAGGAARPQCSPG
jgi:hypothetical protein